MIFLKIYNWLLKLGGGNFPPPIVIVTRLAPVASLVHDEKIVNFCKKIAHITLSHCQRSPYWLL